MFFLVHPEDIFPAFNVAGPGRSGQGGRSLHKYRLADKQGRYHHYAGSFDLVFSQDGKIKQVIGVAKDNTELFRAQKEKMDAVQRAAESEKLVLVGKIAGRMAHDLNNICNYSANAEN